ncbi:MAG TPA: hypothetical protein VFV50_11000 [Bdellovibrionales bacterium]|nr:hypothetical protein [Bdellovibrionales bacterium]
MQKLIWLFASLLMATLLAACAPESKPGLLTDSGEDGEDVEEETAEEVIEFVALCEKPGLSAAVSATIKVLLEATETESCEDAAAVIVEEKSIDLTEMKVQDIEPILVFKSLRYLYLSGTGVSLEQAGQLVLLYNLEVLDLSANGLSSVPELPVRIAKLDLSDNRIVDVGGALKNLTVLTQLSLRQSPVPRLSALPSSLNALDIGATPAERDARNLPVLKSLKNLKELYLTRKTTAEKLRQTFPALGFVLDKPLAIE